MFARCFLSSRRSFFSASTESPMTDEIEAVKETARAVQEVAKTGGKVIDAGRSVGGFLDRVFGRAIEETVGLYWTDKIAAKRVEAAIYSWERLTSLAHKTMQRLKKKGAVTIRAIPPKVALPLLEYATVEHEDDLHTLWANLLATGLDAREEEIHRKYVTTLGEMTSGDALVLRAMFEDAEKDVAKKETKDSSLTYGPGIDGTHKHDSVSVITLKRLGLIDAAYISFKTFEPGGHDDRFGDFGPTRDDLSFPGDLSSVVITPFGRAFGRAVGLDTGSSAQPNSKK
jgi:Abortive infection alpha